MPHTEPIPLHWEMTDPAVLSHRFCLPEKLARYTAVTVADGQQGLIFIGDEPFEAATPGLYMVTGDEIHSLAEGMALTVAGYTPVMPYNAQIILFDTRQKLWQAPPAQLTAGNAETASISMTLVYRVAEPGKLNQISTSPVVTDDGSCEIRQDDPMIAGAFTAAISAMTNFLQGIAQLKASASAITGMLTDSHLCAAACDKANQQLTRLGLQAVTLYLSSTHDQCPFCLKKLTQPEIDQQRCGTLTDRGCGSRLHICPSCQSIVSAESLLCPTCRQELLYCDNCETYRRLEPGQRFCPVCRRACYPLLNRELLQYI